MSLSFSLALLAVVGVGYKALSSQAAERQRLVQLTETRTAARTVQYDFADFNGWQTAYAFDVALDGPSAAADTAASRAAFLASVAQTRLDLARLQSLAEGISSVDPEKLSSIVAGLEEFMTVDARSPPCTAAVTPLLGIGLTSWC